MQAVRTKIVAGLVCQFGGPLRQGKPFDTEIIHETSAHWANLIYAYIMCDLHIYNIKIHHHMKFKVYWINSVFAVDINKKTYIATSLIRLLSLSVYMRNKTGSAENKVKSF